MRPQARRQKGEEALVHTPPTLFEVPTNRCPRNAATSHVGGSGPSSRGGAGQCAPLAGAGFSHDRPTQPGAQLHQPESIFPGTLWHTPPLRHTRGVWVSVELLLLAAHRDAPGGSGAGGSALPGARASLT